MTTAVGELPASTVGSHESALSRPPLPAPLARLVPHGFLSYRNQLNLRHSVSVNYQSDNDEWLEKFPVAVNAFGSLWRKSVAAGISRNKTAAVINEAVDGRAREARRERGRGTKRRRRKESE